MSNDFGKHNGEGESWISYRGRKSLRYVLYEAAILLVGKKQSFGRYMNTTRRGRRTAQKDAIRGGGSLQDIKDILCNPYIRCEV